MSTSEQTQTGGPMTRGIYKRLGSTVTTISLSTPQPSIQVFAHVLIGAQQDDGSKVRLYE